MSKSFNPSVRVWHGYPINEYETYTPPGWMWVLAFALRGVEWAIEEADTPKFKEIIREYYRQEERENKKRRLKYLEELITSYYGEIDQIKKDLHLD